MCIRDSLYIDIGMNRDQAGAQVRVGDLVSFDAPPLAMSAGECIAGKSLDDRAGVAALVILSLIHI